MAVARHELCSKYLDIQLNSLANRKPESLRNSLECITCHPIVDSGIVNETLIFLNLSDVVCPFPLPLPHVREKLDLR